jgi:hypothetical protein
VEAMVLLLELKGDVWGTTLVWSTYVLHNFMTQHAIQYDYQGVLFTMLLKHLLIDWNMYV